ncbi:MAG TPA: carbohydrate kinase family protein, partial [Phototrophicaceae bacterium]|nr:carbohydrate kinase family protein [Phototrophicaceae bacterium]
MKYDILLQGCYFFDQIFSGMPEFPALGREIFARDLTTTGGAMFITAAALRRLGTRVSWAATFGNDYYSKFVYDLAQGEGVDLAFAKHIDRPYRLVTTSVPFQGERAFITYADPEPEDEQGYSLKVVEQCDFKHLHFGGFIAYHDLKPLADLAHQKGATVSMDCQDGDYLQQPCACQDALSLVDIFMPNAREARLITETEDVPVAVQKLTERAKLVVVKDGANGAWVGQGGEILHAPAIAVGPVVDTTGAGDCFNAGFLYGQVVE